MSSPGSTFPSVILGLDPRIQRPPLNHAMNPLLNTTGLPLFDQIAPEHVAPAMDMLLAEADAALARVTAEDFPADWKAIARCWTWPPSGWAGPGGP